MNGGEDVNELTEAQGRDLFDRRCREELGISGDEFLARYDAGEFRDFWEYPVDNLLILLPFAGR